MELVSDWCVQERFFAASIHGPEKSGGGGGKERVLLNNQKVADLKGHNAGAVSGRGSPCSRG